MRVTIFGAQFVLSLAFLGLFAGICAEHAGNQQALEGHRFLVEQRASEQDAMHDPELETSSLLSSHDELPGSTTSTKTTCETPQIPNCATQS